MKNKNSIFLLIRQILTGGKKNIKNENNELQKNKIKKETLKEKNNKTKEANKIKNEEKISKEENKLENILEKNNEIKKNLNKLNKNQIILITQILQKIQNNIDQIFQIIQEEKPNQQKENDLIIKKSLKKLKQNINEKNQLIIEGVFDGQNMIGPDGKKYIVPVNYASKSKLIEGDILKLTITNNGSFIYKQIEPVQKERLKGLLIKDRETNQWEVLAGGNIYKVLTTSVTYFKGENNDEAIILVPKGNKSQWAAIENIIKTINN
jgi:hypothetical protein